MSGKIYLHLLILCGIWTQGITGSFADEENRESLDIVLRQKRVVNYVSGEDQTVPMRWFPYIVKIKYYSRISCVGSILSPTVVITSFLCAMNRVQDYSVVSGKAHLDRGDIHNVTDIKINHGDHIQRSSDGIALLTVHPPFEYGQNTNKIELHSEPLPANAYGMILGWGYNIRSSNAGTCYPRSLRSIKVPIITHQECVNRYRPYIEISDKEICTYDTLKHCGHNDGGAPLVVNGRLAGVHIWTGLGHEQNNHEYPDVFAVLQHFVYRNWIRTHIA